MSYCVDCNKSLAQSDCESRSRVDGGAASAVGNARLVNILGVYAFTITASVHCDAGRSHSPIPGGGPYLMAARSGTPVRLPVSAKPLSNLPLSMAYRNVPASQYSSTIQVSNACGLVCCCATHPRHQQVVDRTDLFGAETPFS